MSAQIHDLLSYLADRVPEAIDQRRRLVGMAYLADWKSCLLRERQITDVVWCFIGGPIPHSFPGLLGAEWRISTNDEGLNREWSTLRDADMPAIEHVIQQTRDLDPVSFARLVQSTYPALTRVGTEPLSLIDLAKRYITSLAA